VRSEDGLNAANTHYLRMTIRDASGWFGAANAGLGGIVVQPGEACRFSVSARCDAAFKGRLAAVLEDVSVSGAELGRFEVGSLSTVWTRYTGTLPGGAGPVDLDVVALFPEHAFHDHFNGLRADLAQKLADMKPGFLRFPGGCIAEGADFGNMYRWKDTIGDIAAATGCSSRKSGTAADPGSTVLHHAQERRR
jgi:alpha-L-arabinofuranosidase